MSTTVRISEGTRSKLRQLAEETGQPMQAVLEQALDSYRRERFFTNLDQAYAALWADPIARREELAERALFEGTLADGLDGV
jgi:predicted transcriptional regulator